MPAATSPMPIHLLCNLHGRYPGLIELALQLCPAGPAQEWLSRASEAFERERLYLVRVTSAVGPLPSTPGAAETESSLSAARHALETLANSERKGCALGAATALVGDWWPIRRLLDRAATRAGLECPAPVTARRSLGNRGYRRCLRRSRVRSRPCVWRRTAFASASRAVRFARGEGLGTRRFLEPFSRKRPRVQVIHKIFGPALKNRWTNQPETLSIKTCSGTSVPEHGNPAGSNRRGLRFLDLRDPSLRPPATPFPHSLHRSPGLTTGCDRASAIVARRSGNSRREASTTAPSAK